MKCPICGTENPSQPICDVCGWEHWAVLGDASPAEKKRYEAEVAKARKAWARKNRKAAPPPEKPPKPPKPPKPKKEKKPPQPRLVPGAGEKRPWGRYLAAGLGVVLAAALVWAGIRYAPGLVGGPDPVSGVWTDPVTGMEFAAVPGGCFQMGCDDPAAGCQGDEGPVREVCVDDFWMGRTEVTRAEWRRFVEAEEYAGEGIDFIGCSGMSDGSGAGDEPVRCVSWFEANAFARWLSAETGETFRLPTEAEWEYAARSGGEDQRYAGGLPLEAVAWHGGNADGGPRRVAAKAANGLGLFDMSGNVWEWCLNSYDERLAGPDAEAPRSAPRSLRGGGWTGPAENCRTTNRDHRDPAFRDAARGFRLVREP